MKNLLFLFVAAVVNICAFAQASLEEIAATPGKAGGVYYAYPEPIAENAPCETPVPLPPAASDALIYLVAAELCDREDGELYTRLLYKYRELLTNTYPSENIKRKNRYYAGRSFGLGKTRLFRG